MLSTSRDPLDIYELFHLVKRRLWWLVACLVLTVGAGVAYLVKAEPVYRVHSRILVEQGEITPDQTRPERDKDFLATQAEIIRSPAVVGRAVETLGLQASGPDEPNPLLTILESLSVNPLLGTNVLSVSLKGPDAEQATRTVEMVIDSYKDYIRESERGEHVNTIRTLTESEQQVRGDLRKLEDEYAQLRKESPLIGQDADRARVQRELLTHLGELLANAKGRRMELENRMLTLEGLRERSIAEAEESHTIPVSLSGLKSAPAAAEQRSNPLATPLLVGSSQHVLLQYTEGEKGVVGDLRYIQEQLLAAQAREKELTQKYGPKHSEVRAVREQISNWQIQLQERSESAPALLQQELEAMRMYEQQLADMYDADFQKAKDIDNYLLKEQQALDHIKRTQELHSSILSQVRQWQLVDQAIAQGKTGINVRVLEEPSLAEQQVWPPKLLVLGACALVGLMGGMGLVLTVGTPTASPSRPAEPPRLRLPVLAHLPVATDEALDAAGAGAPPHVAQAAAAEPLRRLAIALEASRATGSGMSVCMAGAASATTVAALARSLARQGKKVTAIDADLREGTLGERLGVATAPGLDAVLRGELGLEDSLQRSPLAPIDVISRGAHVPGSELPAGGPAEFAALVESLRSQYDYVLIDAPVASPAGDPLGVATIADGVLLVLPEGQSASPAVEQTCQHLQAEGAKLLGAVLIQPQDAAAGSPTEATLQV